MEAHALTARMVQQIQFPFMVFLVSGGHCLLAMAEDVDKYKLLGRYKKSFNIFSVQLSVSLAS